MSSIKSEDNRLLFCCYKSCFQLLFLVRCDFTLRRIVRKHMKNYHTESQFIFRTRAAVGQRHSQFERGGTNIKEIYKTASPMRLYSFFFLSEHILEYCQPWLFLRFKGSAIAGASESDGRHTVYSQGGQEWGYVESGVPFHIHLLATIKEIYLTGHRKFIWPKGLRHSERGRSKTCLTCFYLFLAQNI